LGRLARGKKVGKGNPSKKPGEGGKEFTAAKLGKGKELQTWGVKEVPSQKADGKGLAVKHNVRNRLKKKKKKGNSPGGERLTGGTLRKKQERGGK